MTFALVGGPGDSTRMRAELGNFAKWRAAWGLPLRSYGLVFTEADIFDDEMVAYRANIDKSVHGGDERSSNNDAEDLKVTKREGGGRRRERGPSVERRANRLLCMFDQHGFLLAPEYLLFNHDESRHLVGVSKGHVG